MDMAKYIASGYRRCNCDNVCLLIMSYEYKTEKLFKRWKAVCDKCGKCYLFGDTKKELLQKLNECKLPFKTKSD